VFLGKGFNGLASDRPLEYTKDVEKAFLACLIEGNLPLVYKALRFVPLASVKHWLGTTDRIYQVGTISYI
jgi:hypothetical protein